MNSYNPDENQGALERLGIPVQTTPPEQVLTTGKAKSIRFRVSRPHGYSYGDVESYQFDFVIPTLEWYAETLHQRDLAIHKLGELVDKLEVDLLNVKAQLDNKDYNDALGLAVETSESDEETEALLLKVADLQNQLAAAMKAMEEMRHAGVDSPDGEESYTREQVEGFLASAVEDANNARDTHYANILAEKDSQFAAMMEQVKEQARQEAASANPEGYSEEEVHAAIEDAVNKAVTDAVQKAVAEAERSKDSQYNALVSSHAAALLDAEARITESESKAKSNLSRADKAEQKANTAEERAANAEKKANEAEERAANAEAQVEEAENRAAKAETTTTGYSQEELENAIAQAVATKEAEILSQIPDAQPIDQIAELTNEGDLKLRAENKTLKRTVEELDNYSKELEKYIATLEGTTIEAPAAAHGNNSHGRPLPELRADDL